MRRLVPGSLITVLALGASGCGDSEAVEDPTTSTSSRVDLATGVLITSNTATVNAPANFKKSPLIVSLGASVNGPDARYDLGLSEQEIPLESEILDYVSKLSQTASVYKLPLERQPDTTVAGRPAYHLSGPDSIFGRWTEEFGFGHEGHTINVTVSNPLDLPRTNATPLPRRSWARSS